MSRFVRRHRLGLAKISIPAILAFTALLSMWLAVPNHAGGKKEPLAPPDEQISDSTDLDGTPSFEAIISSPAGQNENNPDPGQVLIQYDNGSLTIFEGKQNDDWFGASVAIAGDINVDPNEDFNGDGHADLIVGAPHEQPSGFAYVFYGPFAPGQELDPEDADMKFHPPEAAVYDFGMNVRQIADIDCDGTPDIGIGGVQPVPGGGGGTIIVTYFISGASGDPLYIAEGASPFDPWLEIVGDAEGDGDVDNVDIAIINRNMGRISPRLTVRDGDFNGDGRITQADKTLAQANFGADHFAPVRGCTNPCPNPPPAGFHCIFDCHGDPVLVPINIWEYCDPIMCTQSCWCGYDIFPFPNNMPDTPHWLSIYQVYYLQFGADEEANWEITEGEDNIIVLPESNGEQLVFLTTHYGPVTVEAGYYCCASGGWCYLEVPMLVTCEGIPNPYGDNDNDGIGNGAECEAGLNPDFSDTDGDSMPDNWEIAYGFDPLDPADGLQNPDGDNVPNYLEYLYGSNPYNQFSGAPAGQDPDGDGVITWFEEMMGTDPENGNSYFYPDFTSGDMLFAVVNDVLAYLNTEIMVLCEGDCFKLHAQGWAQSWQVLQGGQYLDEVQPDLPSSCISAKWCITGEDISRPVDIVIASYTPNPHGGGMPTFGFVHIIALPADHPDCGGQCEIEVTSCDGAELPVALCIDQQICLKAEGAGGQPGTYQWSVESGVPGSVSFVGGNTGPQVTIQIHESDEIYIGVNRGECSGGKTIYGTLIDLDIDCDYDGKITEDDDSIENSSTFEGSLTFFNYADENENGVPGFADGINVFGNDVPNGSLPFVPLTLSIGNLEQLPDPKIKFTYSSSNPAQVTMEPAGYGFDFAPAAGMFRIWRKDGPEVRLVSSLKDDGDYITTELLDANTLLSGSDTVTLYLETVIDTISGPVPITVELYPDHKGNPDQICEDVVKVSTAPVFIPNP